MKKITLFFVFAILGAFTFSSYAQTLNQAASWPNANWTLSGTYTPGGLLGDPAVNSTFTWDDDGAGNGSADAIMSTSPVIDLTAASGAGETWITVSGDFTYRELGGDVLAIEVYDADAMTWAALHTFAGNTTANDYQTCANTVAYTTGVLNISGFTPTQLSGFQYRITYDDQGGWQWGWCLTSPTITSAAPPSCPDPASLTVSSIDGFSAMLGWTESGSATLWNVEIVDVTAAGVPTGTPTASGVANPYMAAGLTPSNNYEYYVQADCGGSTSAWVGPFAFTTTVACPEPSALTATNILTTSADLGWTMGGSEGLWDIELVDITAAGVPTGTATASGVANPYSATGLTDSNQYEFYVRADCAANGTSTWVGPFAFTTACTIFTAPYTQDFENAGALPACWANGGDEDWLFETSGPNHVGNGGTLSGATTSGAYYAVVDDSTPDAANAELTSPLVDVSGLANPTLTFFEISDNETNANATLTVSVYDGAAWNTVGTYNTNTAGWELKTIPLNALTFTGPAQARFSVADSGSFYDDIAIDDVRFAEGATCMAPTATFAVVQDCTNGFTVNIDVTDLGNGASYDVQSGGASVGTISGTGITNVGPFTNDTAVSLTIVHPDDTICNVLSTSLVNTLCPTLITCGTPTNNTFCYDSNENLEWLYTSADATSLLTLVIVDGQMETCCDTLTIYDGADATGAVLFSGNGSTFTTATYNATGTSIFVTLDSDGSVSCAQSGYTPINYDVHCTSTAPPANDDCADATAITLGTEFSGDTTNATDSGIADAACSMSGGNQDVWYSFVAPVSTTVALTTTADFLAIYDACGGSEVACLSNGGQSPALTAGNTYYARVYNSGFAKIAGPFTATLAEASLSTQDFDNGLAFSYYPNPVKNTLTLNAQQAISNVAVYNMLGQEVIRTAPNAVSNDVDMSSLQSGAYFVQVTVGTVVETVRIIKN